VSKFFKALEQAEKDRSRQEGESPLASEPAPPAREPVPLLARMRVEVPPHVADEAPPDAATSPPAPVSNTSTQSREVPREINGIESHLISLIAPAAFETEQYRNLRTLLETARAQRQGYVVGISSPGMGDGKTTTAINLAGVLAEGSDARVLLIDADLRNPAIHRKLGMTTTRDRGLMSLIADRALSLRDVLTTRPPLRLQVLPAERSLSSPYEVLKSPRFGELLEEARRDFDYVVLDTPPLVSLSDCRLIGNWVDGFLIIIAANRTPRKLVEEALNVIDPSKVLGFVFNGDDRSFERYKYYSYGYSNGFGRRDDGSEE
jgi:protein-tyrosine kinase